MDPVERQKISRKWIINAGVIPEVSETVYVAVSEDRLWWTGWPVSMNGPSVKDEGDVYEWSLPVYQLYNGFSGLEFWEYVRLYLIKYLLPTLSPLITESYPDRFQLIDLE